MPKGLNFLLSTTLVLPAPNVRYSALRATWVGLLFFLAATARARSSHSLLVSQMARGKGKTKQSSLQTAGLLSTLKKPREAIGFNLP